ncbi:hypothetical protein D3C84_1217730 [compost metagenome]
MANSFDFMAGHDHGGDFPTPLLANRGDAFGTGDFRAQVEVGNDDVAVTGHAHSVAVGFHFAPPLLQ